jgi:hypothetical protein
MRLTRLPPRRSGVGLLIILTAPWGVFWASWEIWDGLRVRESLTDLMEYQVFWLLVFTRQPESAETHAHLLVAAAPLARRREGWSRVWAMKRAQDRLRAMKRSDVARSVLSRRQS